MAKTHICKRVGLDFVDTAPIRLISTVDLAITPDQLFEVLADAESWPHWVTAITKVVWTSPEPRGVGTTRSVTLRGGVVGHEEFLVWEPFSRITFRFNEIASSALSAAAEDYRVVPTARGCRLRWVMALEPRGWARAITMTLARPVLGWQCQRFLHNLQRYTEDRYSIAAQSGRPRRST